MSVTWLFQPLTPAAAQQLGASGGATATPSTVLGTTTFPAVTGVSSGLSVVGLLAQENCDDTDNTTLNSGNSIFELHNGTGSSTYQDSPTPVSGTTCLAFDGSSSTNRTAKDTSSLPGTTNGGVAIRKVFARFYTRVNNAPGGISRLFVFEESVANGGADVGCIRMNATGAFAILDGSTSRGASTRTISTTEWTRV